MTRPQARRPVRPRPPFLDLHGLELELARQRRIARGLEVLQEARDARHARRHRT